MIDLERALAGVGDLERIGALACRAARELTGADGATFVVRELDRVRYVAEDAVAPLWSGRDFPIESCISGWAIRNAAQIAIPDIYADERIPHAAYRPTFVTSLAMTPVGDVASIGAYWAREHAPTWDELAALRELATTIDRFHPARTSRLAGRRILLVDDNVDSVEILGMLLENHGAVVSIAYDGEQALRTVETVDFDLVVSDIAMPGMNGYDLMRSLRQLERFRSTPSIALTGYGRANDLERAADAGFTTHLTKPIDFASLVRLATTLR